ncbi:hypothetical protein RclHR1_08720004 [Rhizophagus clarus]|uniref:Kinase-like domain-containing protein n=1 Tax=Rhizophagus clarus TaxID=94130 RepID=A0A2Z6S477_9GLOM|nr:hypothetical protein RclHR1_08720004 [Rhizophagus clarus]GES82588.1 kinase-like domain-containing protein [Rhizophagus clarus]
MNEVSSGEKTKPRSVRKKLAEKISRFTSKYKNLFKSKKKSSFRPSTSSSSSTPPPPPLPSSPSSVVQTFEKFQEVTENDSISNINNIPPPPSSSVVEKIQEFTQNDSNSGIINNISSSPPPLSPRQPSPPSPTSPPSSIVEKFQKFTQCDSISGINNIPPPPPSLPIKPLSVMQTFEKFQKFTKNDSISSINNVPPPPLPIKPSSVVQTFKKFLKFTGNDSINNIQPRSEHIYKTQTPEYGSRFCHSQRAYSKKPWDERETTNDVINIQKYSFGWCIECGMEFSGMKWCRPCNAAHFYRQTSEWTSWRLGLDNLIIETQIIANNVHSFFEWIPFENFDHVTYLAKGGYSIVYKAIWRQGPITYWDTTTNNWERFGGHEVVLKVIKGSQKNLDEFINELSAHHKFGITVGHVLRCFGISRWEGTGDFIVVTSYAKDGNLRQYIRENLRSFSWIERIITLKDIAKGLEIIHNSGYVHRDLHTGNILRHGSWTMVSDLGLTWRHDSVSTSERFGVLPYMAPETLSCGQYSSASDIYSFAMIMYEIASGKIPFYHMINDINAINIIQGSRPKIPFATPPTYIQIMKSCWDADPKKRPTASFLVKTFDDWIHSKRKQLVTIYNSFQNAEDERKNSITDIEDDHIPIINQTSQLISCKWPTEVHQNAENKRTIDNEKNHIFTAKNSTVNIEEDYIFTIDQTSQLISIKWSTEVH